LTKDQYDQAISTLKVWQKAYYQLDNPVATDDEWDNLYRQVELYESNNPDHTDPSSPTKTVGDTVQKKFNKQAHITPMWSLEDLFDIDELRNWVARCEKTVKPDLLICEPKYDGVSLNIIYKQGKLFKAITRGDGKVGEDVTQNAKTIDTIPKSISYMDDIEIRGEVVITKSQFDKINSQRAKDNKPLFANPRNMAAGSLKQLDSSITKSRKLEFILWGVGQNSLKFDRVSQIMEFVYSLGFDKPIVSKHCHNIEDIEKFYRYMIDQRDKIDIALDGMVIKYDLVSYQQILGWTVKYPKWSCAYKFPAVEKSTKLVGISLQVGRTGAVTPVAILEPVPIDGSTVGKASLHNFDEIDRLGLMIGDEVVVLKSGDIIPKIVKVLKDRRTGTEIPIDKPTNCPTCGQALHYEDILIKCVNLQCPDKVINSIAFFASKGCANIDGLGEKIVKLLYEKKIISNILDIYKLKRESLVGLESFKDKKIDNLLQAIENSKNMKLSKFINSLGILNIGEVASVDIVKQFGDKFIDVSIEQLVYIDGFGDIMAKSFVEFMDINRQLVCELIDTISPIVDEFVEVTDNRFKDKTVVLTGTMAKSRNEIKQKLENMGAKVGSAVSSSTDFLIIGEKVGSKLKKASKLGIEVLTYDNIIGEIDG